MNTITELNRFEAAGAAEVVAAKQAAATVRLESVQEDGTRGTRPPRLSTGEAELDRVWVVASRLAPLS